MVALRSFVLWVEKRVSVWMGEMRSPFLDVDFSSL